MKIDESRMKVHEKPTLFQRIRYAFVSLIFGLFFLYITGIILFLSFFSNLTFYAVLVPISVVLILLGWVFGDEFTGFMHAKILNIWNPKNMFR